MNGSILVDININDFDSERTWPEPVAFGHLGYDLHFAILEGDFGAHKAGHYRWYDRVIFGRVSVAAIVPGWIAVAPLL